MCFVMGTGILAGAILKAITGFGSTIAHLCIWSLFHAAGVASGTIQQAVVTEAIFRAVTGIPYLLMTRARETANVKLVISISLFQSLGSPLGAYLLSILDGKVLELTIAGALLVVLIIPLIRRRSKQAPTTTDESSGLSEQLLRDSSHLVSDEDLEAIESVEEGGKDDGLPLGDAAQGDEVSLGSWQSLVLAGSAAGTLSGLMGGLTGIDGPPTIFMFQWLNVSKAVVRGTNAVINMCFMFVLLPCYVWTGAFTVKDLPLYLIGSVVGMVGTVVGDVLTHRIDQNTFVYIMKAMVWVCCALMTLSGLGLVDPVKRD